MAFRVCRWILKKSTPFSRVARCENASSFSKKGFDACCRENNTFAVTPVCFITSDAFLNRLTKRKAEIDDRHTAFVPPDSGEQISLLMKHPDQPEKSNVLKVAIIGSPNAGKSTLSNQLLGRKVFAVSKKVHTTRSRALGVLTEEDTQIILLDTPGLTTPSKVKRHQLEKSLLVDPWNTVREADLMVVMVDVADKWMCRSLDFEVLKCLAKNPDIPAVLVLNKTDLLKNKSKLLETTAELTCGMVNGRRVQIRPAIKPPRAEQRPTRHEPPPEVPAGKEGSQAEGSVDSKPGLLKEQLRALKGQKGWPHFKDVFMLSSVDQLDVETLKRYLVVAAKPGTWQYHSEVLTDQTPREICGNIIREKLLEYLPKEVPYTMTQCIEFWQETENGELDIVVKLYAMKDSHMKMVIGTAGQMVARLAREAGEDLSRLFLKEVKLRLSVKLKN